MDRERFVVRVREYGRNEERRVRRLRILAIHELASGVAVLLDNGEDFSVIFDSDTWEFNHPKPAKGSPACSCWGPRDLDRPLKIFVGQGGNPPAKTFDQVLAYAKSHLKPREGVELSWLDKPAEIALAA